jgi:hypothetical protein
MDTSTAIAHLARAEARRVRPVRDDPAAIDRTLDELDAPLGRRLPAFTIERCGGKQSIRAVPLSNRSPTHDNAPRLEHLCGFLNRSVLPLVDPEARLSGTFRIELHDAYSYLPDRHLYSNVLTFGRAVDALERNVALFPDPYHMDAFGGGSGVVARASADPVKWQDKEPLLFFAGTTTGDRRASANARLRACAWGATRPDMARMLITNVAQMPLGDVVAAYGSETASAFLRREPAPVEEHFGYRYVANIVGNTACWSRLPMIMSSQSLMVHVRHADAMWYYPLLREGRHYVAADSVDGPDLERAVHFCRSYDRQCRAMVAEANLVAHELFSTPAPAASYAAELLTEAAILYAA